MELAVLGDIPLGVWIIHLLWPFDCVAHVLHNGYTLNGFDIEGVLGPRGVMDDHWIGWMAFRVDDWCRM